jgi:hypothetical protein
MNRVLVGFRAEDFVRHDQRFDPPDSIRDTIIFNAAMEGKRLEEEVHELVDLEAHDDPLNDLRVRHLPDQRFTMRGTHA